MPATSKSGLRSLRTKTALWTVCAGEPPTAYTSQLSPSITLRILSIAQSWLAGMLRPALVCCFDLGLKINVNNKKSKIQENSRKFHFSFKIEVKNEFSPIFCIFFSIFASRLFLTPKEDRRRKSRANAGSYEHLPRAPGSDGKRLQSLALE